MSQNVRVGVGVLIFKNNKILLGQRKNSHGEKTWAPPGGHLDWFETPEECAQRETFEETELHLENIKRGPWCNDIFEKANKHYMTIFMMGSVQGEPKLKEPNKCYGWSWHSINKLPSPLFLPLSNVLKDNPDLFKVCILEKAT